MFDGLIRFWSAHYRYVTYQNEPWNEQNILTANCGIFNLCRGSCLCQPGSSLNEFDYLARMYVWGLSTLIKEPLIYHSSATGIPLGPRQKRVDVSTSRVWPWVSVRPVADLWLTFTTILSRVCHVFTMMLRLDVVVMWHCLGYVVKVW